MTTQVVTSTETKHDIQYVTDDEQNGVLIKDIEVTDKVITAHLMDGRTIRVPLAWSWRLSEAKPEQRAHYEIIGMGQGVHWADVDEDISARGMLYGMLAPRPRTVA